MKRDFRAHGIELEYAAPTVSRSVFEREKAERLNWRAEGSYDSRA
jgi:hypothetical protein